MITYHQSMTDRRAMEKARRFTRDNIALAILEPPPHPTPPPQLIAKMRPLRRAIKFLRRDNAFVDVQLRMSPLVQRSPLCRAPEAVAKIAQSLTLPKPGLMFCRFLAKNRHCPHSITHH